MSDQKFSISDTEINKLNKMRVELLELHKQLLQKSSDCDTDIQTIALYAASKATGEAYKQIGIVLRNCLVQ